MFRTISLIVAFVIICAFFIADLDTSFLGSVFEDASLFVASAMGTLSADDFFLRFVVLAFTFKILNESAQSSSSKIAELNRIVASQCETIVLLTTDVNANMNAVFQLDARNAEIVAMRKDMVAMRRDIATLNAHRAQIAVLNEANGNLNAMIYAMNH